MTDHTAPADPREALAAVNKAIDYLDPGLGVGPPSVVSALATLRSLRSTLAARQDEPSPALRAVHLPADFTVAETIEAMRDAGPDVQVHLPENFTASEANAVIAALAANPPQTREAEEAGLDVEHRLSDLVLSVTAMAITDEERRAGWQRIETPLRKAWLAAKRLPLSTHTFALAANPPQAREAEGAALRKPKMDDDCPDFCSRWPGCGHTEADFMRTPEAQGDAEPPAMTGSITERHSGDIGGQRDAGNRGIDAALAYRQAVHDEFAPQSIGCHSEKYDPSEWDCVKVVSERIAAALRATQPPAAGTEGTE